MVDLLSFELRLRNTIQLVRTVLRTLTLARIRELRFGHMAIRMAKFC